MENATSQDSLIVALDANARKKIQKATGHPARFKSKDFLREKSIVHSVLCVPKGDIITAGADAWPWASCWTFQVYDDIDKAEYYCVLGSASMRQLGLFADGDKSRKIEEPKDTPVVRKYLAESPTVAVCSFEQLTDANLNVAPMSPLAGKKSDKSKNEHAADITDPGVNGAGGKPPRIS